MMERTKIFSHNVFPGSINLLWRLNIITVSVSNSYCIIPNKSGQVVSLSSYINLCKAPLNWWSIKRAYLASRRIGSRGGYMERTTSSTLWGNSEGGTLAWVRIVFMPSCGRANITSYLGLMRLATVMMSLRLAGALTFAPEPIVMATSFSVNVWQICMWKRNM